jgi:two-component system alkaline phosphatase synthesis response regulator PhoP
VDEPLILIVDDEEDILTLLEYNLQESGFRTQIAATGREAISLAEQDTPDLVILDVMMPVMDGIEACRLLRAKPEMADTPIVMLTARSGEEDHVRGLDVGADIYLSKPLSIPVILSQIKALLRRSDPAVARPLIVVHDLTIDRERYVVLKTVDGNRETFHLPRKEFELLSFLASNPGRVFGRDELLDSVWGSGTYVVDRTVDVHVRKIREKLGSAYIETVKGVGYRFRE